jgi:hypothetical protein
MSGVIVVKQGQRRAVIAAGQRGRAGVGFDDAPADGEFYARKDSTWSPIASAVAGVATFNGRGGAVTLVGGDVIGALGFSPATAAQGAKADTAVQPGALALVATSGAYADLAGKPFIPAAPGDIGAASSAQGALADTAVQPTVLAAGLDAKVDKLAGYGLSQSDFTAAEKAKLAALESSHFKGTFTNLVALQAAYPTASVGDYADVDAGAGDPVLRYIWDASDSEWVAQAGSADPVTAAQVKTLYESNPDTNAFTDAEQAKLGGVAAGATANANTDSLAEGATNLYHTEARVRGTVLTGLSLLAGGAISAADTLLSALGKLQKQITDAVTSIGGKQDTLVSGTNLKTVNGTSLLGSGDLTITGSADNSTETVAISSGTLNLSATTKEVIVVDLNQNVTTVTMPAGVAGQAVNRRIVFTQSGAANFTVAGWGSVSIEGGTAPTASTGTGAVTEYMLSNTNNGGWRMYVDQSSSVSSSQLAKAWVNFNGTGTVAIRASYNVSSITDNGTGDYTVNFTTAMVDANYAVSGTVGSGTVTTDDGYWISERSPDTARSSSSVRIVTKQHGAASSWGPNPTDLTHISLTVFR